MRPHYPICSVGRSDHVISGCSRVVSIVSLTSEWWSRSLTIGCLENALPKENSGNDHTSSCSFNTYRFKIKAKGYLWALESPLSLGR